LAGALLYDEKIRQVLLYYGFDCRPFVTYSTNEPFSKEQLLTLPHFWSSVWQKRLRFVPIQPVCRRNRGNGFLYEAAQNFEVFSNIQD
jgi:hypothetical protein